MNTLEQNIGLLKARFSRKSYRKCEACGGFLSEIRINPRQGSIKSLFFPLQEGIGTEFLLPIRLHGHELLSRTEEFLKAFNHVLPNGRFEIIHNQVYFRIAFFTGEEPAENLYKLQLIRIIVAMLSGLFLDGLACLHDDPSIAPSLAAKSVVSRIPACLPLIDSEMEFSQNPMIIIKEEE